MRKSRRSLCLRDGLYVKMRVSARPQLKLRRKVLRQHVSLKVTFEPQTRAVPRAGVTLQLCHSDIPATLLDKIHSPVREPSKTKLGREPGVWDTVGANVQGLGSHWWMRGLSPANASNLANGRLCLMHIFQMPSLFLYATQCRNVSRYKGTSQSNANITASVQPGSCAPVKDCVSIGYYVRIGCVQNCRIITTPRRVELICCVYVYRSPKCANACRKWWIAPSCLFVSTEAERRFCSVVRFSE